MIVADFLRNWQSIQYLKDKGDGSVIERLSTALFGRRIQSGAGCDSSDPWQLHCLASH